jgi:hypothetical protein
VKTRRFLRSSSGVSSLAMATARERCSCGEFCRRITHE